MEAEGWNEVVELLANTAWTSQDLKEKHGVRNSIEIFLQLSSWNCLRIFSLRSAELIPWK